MTQNGNTNDDEFPPLKMAPSTIETMAITYINRKDSSAWNVVGGKSDIKDLIVDCLSYKKS